MRWKPTDGRSLLGLSSRFSRYQKHALESAHCYSQPAAVDVATLKTAIRCSDSTTTAAGGPREGLRSRR